MALFPPEFLAGLLLAFLQLRLRSHLSVAAWLVSGLSFFLPPDDELLAVLNGRVPGAKSSGPLSANDKLANFYVRSAQTEPGVFAQTLFYELYEMLVVVATSALGGCVIGDLLGVVIQQETTNMAVYGLLSALLVSLWFPLQLQRAQGLLASYESRLAVAVGIVAFIVAAFAIASPKNLFDFDVERAADVAGQRIALALTAFGFVDEDFVNIAPATETARWGFFFSLAFTAAAFAASLFLPAFRFARMYMAMTRNQNAKVKPLVLLLLHVNMWSPLLVAAFWMPALLQKPLVHSLGLLTLDQFHTLRLYVVLLAAVLRLLGFRRHLQFFLLEPRDTMAAAIVESGNGPIDGGALQRAARIQFNYAPVVAIQYLAPIVTLVASAALLARQGGMSLGVISGLQSLVALATGVAPSNSTPEVDWTIAPDLGGFRLGDELDRENAAKLLKGMAAFPVLTPEFYASVVGFLLWFVSFTTLVVSVSGILYWKNTQTVPSITVSASTAAGKARGKASKKSLKLKKH